MSLHVLKNKYNFEEGKRDGIDSKYTRKRNLEKAKRPTK